MTITVHQRPLEATRTPGKSCKWSGEAIVNGRTYTATSRMAPANDIARQLVADGVPDAPMQVYSAGLKGCLVWRSFYKAAGYTIEETITKPVREVRWEHPDARAARIAATFGPKQGVKAPAGRGVAAEHSAAQIENGRNHAAIWVAKHPSPAASRSEAVALPGRKGP